MSWLPDNDPEGFSIFDKEFVNKLEEINVRKDDKSAAKRSTIDCEFIHEYRPVVPYSYLLEDKETRVYVVNFHNVTRIHMLVWRLCELLHEDIGITTESVEEIIRDFRHCVNDLCWVRNSRHGMRYRDMWFDFWFMNVYWPFVSRRILCSRSGCDRLRTIECMEIFGFDVQRVRDILEINCYVPTERRDVYFWVLNYLSCKLMNYTEGTSSVLLHAAGR